MIGALLAVFRKDLLETLRDRRALVSSLVMGPLFAPIMFFGALTLSLKHNVAAIDETVAVTVTGAERAPNLVQFLRGQGLAVTLRDGEDPDIRRWIEDGAEEVVLAVPRSYGESFRGGQPARVLVYADGSNSKAGRRADRVRSVLAAYSGQVAALRLQARGVSPLVVQAVVADEVDV